MKKLILIFIFMLLIPFTVNAKDNLVKVYVFGMTNDTSTTDGINELKKLPSYNKKFKIIFKETYIKPSDTYIGDWPKGKDYDLVEKIQNVFIKAGQIKKDEYNFYQAPLFFISDNFYMNSIENVSNAIDIAYKNGDKDIVGCVIDGKEDCTKLISEKENKNNNYFKKFIMFVILFFIVMIGVIFVFILKDVLKRRSYDRIKKRI